MARQIAGLGASSDTRGALRGNRRGGLGTNDNSGNNGNPNNNGGNNGQPGNNQAPGEPGGR